MGICGPRIASSDGQRSNDGFAHTCSPKFFVRAVGLMTVRSAYIFKCLLVVGLLAPTPLYSSEWLEDVTKESGLDFVHFNGMTGQFSIAEVIGSGAALFDYDLDGDLDLYLVQGGMMWNQDPAKATFPLKKGQSSGDRLFRNDLVVNPDGSRTQRFVDVTEQSGLKVTGYGMGVAVGDADGDGFEDLYITQYGPDQLWRNLGNGTFRNMTPKQSPFPAGWSTSASFFDYDRDGDLDLYVCNYLNYTDQNRKTCYTAGGEVDYCGPKTYDAVADTLLENTGNGSFKDVTTLKGIHKAFGAALGVVAADFNNDGWMDLFVANDGAANQLWVNQAGKGFEDEGLLAGCSLNADGNPEASMGVAIGDYDNDGDQDLFVTHLRKETNTLYVNDGNGWFEDLTIRSGLASPSTAYTAFGTGWLDLDNDGLLDLMSLNGTVQIIEALRKKNDPFPLHQPNQVFLNLGSGKYQDVSAKFGTEMQRSEVSRGLAIGDIDNDGDADVVITNNNGPVRMLRNGLGQQKAWLGIVPVNQKGRIVPQATVKLEFSNAQPMFRWTRTDGSFLSAGDPRVLFGLGKGQKPKHVEITWPDGTRERWLIEKTSAYITCRKASGTLMSKAVSP